MSVTPEQALDMWEAKMSAFDPMTNAGHDIADLHDEWKKEEAMTANITPEQLRKWAELIGTPEYDYRKPSVADIQEQLHDHAAALEELARLKAPVDVAGLVERLRAAEAMIGAMCSDGRPPKMSIPAQPDRDEDIVICDTMEAARTALESLAAQLAEAQRNAGAYRKDWMLAKDRAERYEQRLIAFESAACCPDEQSCKWRAQLAERDAELAAIKGPGAA